MIDITAEKVIAIHDVPKLLPHRSRTGRRVHVSAVYRWIQRGVHGVKLETVKIGGTRYTSQEALQRFSERLTQARQDPLPPTPMTTVARQRQVERAAREVGTILHNPRGSQQRPQRIRNHADQQNHGQDLQLPGTTPSDPTLAEGNNDRNP